MASPIIGKAGAGLAHFGPYLGCQVGEAGLTGGSVAVGGEFGVLALGQGGTFGA